MMMMMTVMMNDDDDKDNDVGMMLIKMVMIMIMIHTDSKIIQKHKKHEAICHKTLTCITSAAPSHTDKLSNLFPLFKQSLT